MNRLLTIAALALIALCSRAEADVLTWEHPDGVTVDSYRFYSSTSKSGPFTNLAAQVLGNVTNVAIPTTATRTYFQGRSVIAGEESAPTATVWCPVALGGFRVTAVASTSVTFVWSAAAVVDEVTHYQIYGATSPNGPWSMLLAVPGANSTSATVQTTVKFFRAAACNEFGVGRSSVVVSRPGPPGKLTVRP